MIDQTSTPEGRLEEPKKVQAAPTNGHSDEAANVRAQSKIAAVVELLSREGGASLVELVAATSWQPHTTRAALTRLRKSHTMAKSKADGATRYTILAMPGQ